MNKSQEMWWRQAASDYAVFELLRSQGVAACHPLHFLQMSTEKIAKAAFWSRNTAPAMSHVGFVSFLKKLGSTPSKKRSQLASLFEFPNFNSFQAWLPTACQLGRQIETIAPAVAIYCISFRTSLRHFLCENVTKNWLSGSQASFVNEMSLYPYL